MEWNYYDAINWNNIEDIMDKMTYEKLTEQFWLSTRMPVSKDKSDWTKLPDPEKRLVEKVFGGLTMLDTLQSENGIDALRKDAKTQHEIAVLNNIQFMESEHARSYSSIFSTLNTKKEIEDIFRWAREDDFLQTKARIIDEIYQSGTPLEKKVASVYLGRAKLINVAEVIKLIIRDESAHGAYIGYKFKIGFEQLTDSEKEAMKSWTYSLLYKLYENEVKYTESLYDQVGWTEDVKVFLRYNANKALMNLGLAPLFPDTADDVNPIVINGLSTGTTNHDFFSTVGNGYLLSVVEDMKESDYDY
ncbi:class 1b ribonucleoside-diphosphate reductase subunit beta [Heyndrickxia sporothermodurans]|uniref:ribonucleoside-diphosphate reductase n=1 Tax=Heyndrickxia sporothermodurans TaxID=46224 RepID=A0AB37HDR0_9BACI|nr:class 1b ribonucleoside-diphosphate reductase subunit beta [Heyndrickxia sporothermodurans]MBL5767874.1 class 1b ribonucleoside-diphosphate reductase subunit beta [Heyndrickxia sporothermodurans]MBL5771474.1 class 1b ribonucleoside-diphosphate reductase subunit beta [Heyndrickxia sporothermodurans]MBL5775155.1 class 1b ribonucleoside-diphosphate reductase subunit beta [Heyndrickxia sporothermodurans]MBL5778578.1 class 1b ribonucleoside-diphosphate reductase subunit beta [Heyndrickxia sporoth